MPPSSRGAASPGQSKVMRPLGDILTSLRSFVERGRYKYSPLPSRGRGTTPQSSTRSFWADQNRSTIRLSLLAKCIALLVYLAVIFAKKNRQKKKTAKQHTHTHTHTHLAR